ncbi:MAG: hypothetical protein KJO30_11695 [Boseongicola sp.]|nr:hypothetical protein [Boseongicola sp.]NNJ69208.1 hypothetical protein [Boseongicola sp.]
MPASVSHLLTRQSHRGPKAPAVTVLEDVTFERGRAHEICGNARRTMAFAVAQAMVGNILWIRPTWAPGRLNPEGFMRFVDPGRIIMATPKRPEDLLWCTEEALRAGVVPLIVADLPGPPGLTAVRRLHLAAETGAELSGSPPLGLLLTPEKGGAPGVESRWAMNPAHVDTKAEAWVLDRVRARTAPEKRFYIKGLKEGFALTERPSSDASAT